MIRTRSGMVGRKGISPLIATVLLLALAVALGTMAVSYILEAMRSGPCDDVSVAVLEDVGVCYRDGHVSVIITNQGEKPLYNAMLRFVDAKGDLYEKKVALALSKGASLKVEVPYQSIAPDSSMLYIVPTVAADNDESFCEDKKVTTAIKICG